VWLRPEPAAEPAGEWAFGGWNNCDTRRTVRGVEECGVHSGAFSSDERGPVALFEDRVNPEVSNLLVTPSETDDLTFKATFDVAGGTAVCNIDDGPTHPCSSGNLLQLAEGRYFFRVRAVDPSGNESRVISAEVRSINTRIESGPTGTTRSRSASFTVGSTMGTEYWCSIDGRADQLCATSTERTVRFDGLADGEHTLSVYAAQVGWRDHLPAVRRWTVDGSAPTTTIRDVDTSGNELVAEFSTESGATSECRLAHGGVTGAWQACASPWRKAGLPDGDHRFEVRSTDAAGNIEDPAKSRTVTVDATAPDTRITSGPSAILLGHSTTLKYTSTEAARAWACRLDDAASTCGSSTATLTGLVAGSHLFEVAAEDHHGNVDASPARRGFTVPLSAGRLKRSSGWKTTRSTRVFDGIAFKSTKKGATLSRSVTGAKSLVLVVSRGRGHGTVGVYAGSKLLRTVKLASSSSRTKQVITVGGLRTPFTGTVKLRVASSGRTVQVEGLAVVTR
jgi:hypothetical protein